MNKRDYIGCICWYIVSLFIGLLALPIMVAREYYQYKHYHLQRIEGEDIVRYGIVIGLGVLTRCIYEIMTL